MVNDRYNSFAKVKSPEEKMIEKHSDDLKKELLFFHQNIDFNKLNPFH
jgi:hypothetical protein